MPTQKPLALTDRQIATVLAALEYWQQNTDEEERAEESDYFSDDETSPLTNAQIDRLTSRLEKAWLSATGAVTIATGQPEDDEETK